MGGYSFIWRSLTIFPFFVEHHLAGSVYPLELLLLLGNNIIKINKKRGKKKAFQSLLLKKKVDIYHSIQSLITQSVIIQSNHLSPNLLSSNYHPICYHPIQSVITQSVIIQSVIIHSNHLSNPIRYLISYHPIQSVIIQSNRCSIKKNVIICVLLLLLSPLLSYSC